MWSAGELWVSLAEKAYAKLHGSYGALDSGSLSDALVDLTAGVVSKMKLDNPECREMVDNGALWTRLSLYCSWGYILAAVHKAHSARVHDPAALGGLLPDHAYSVIDCRQLLDGTRLVRVHNPWPGGQWQGAWSHGAREWEVLGAAGRFLNCTCSHLACCCPCASCQLSGADLYDIAPQLHLQSSLREETSLRAACHEVLS